MKLLAKVVEISKEFLMISDELKLGLIISLLCVLIHAIHL